MSASGIMASLRGSVSRDSYKYSTLPTLATSRQKHAQQEASLSKQPLRLVKMSLGGMAFAAILFMTVSFGRATPTHEGCELSGSCADDVSRVWGQYSPFFPVHSTIDAATPSGCQVTFAQVLSRHGARAPTQKKAVEYKATIDRIKSTVTVYGTGYEFIKDYKYTLGQDDLTVFGEQQMAESGVAFFQRYKSLAKDSEPFIRAAGSDRVIASAQKFATGYYGALGRDASDSLRSILVIPEESGFNNSLDHGNCDAFEEGPASKVKEESQKQWLGIWAPPVAQRLNERLAGANLSVKETVYMMDLCPFNTVATPNATLSDFCKLFSKDEWTSYNYYQSLDKWYGYGKGNPLGPSQGVGFGNELIARLTGRPVDDHTSTNSTLDSSPDTFPLDRKLYADFSHDNTMSSIYAALGLYNATQDLPLQKKLSPQKLDGFSASWAVPFSARMYVEKMLCGSDEELVRVLVNDRVVPLQNCGADSLGRCKLSAFIDSLTFVRNGGLWDQCFSKRTAAY